MSSSRVARRLPFALAALVAAPLLLGACGSSSNTAATTNQPAATSAPATKAPTTTTAPDEETTTTAKKKSTTTTEAGDSGDTTTTKAVTDPAYKDFCAAMVTYDQQFKNADENDPKYLTEAKAAYQNLYALAPDAIKADVGTVNTFVQGMSSFNDFLSAPQAVQDAGARLGTITQEQCGVS